MAKLNKISKAKFDKRILDGEKGSEGICDTCMDNDIKIVYEAGGIVSMCEHCLTYDRTKKETSAFMKYVFQNSGPVIGDYCPTCKGTGRIQTSKITTTAK